MSCVSSISDVSIFVGKELLVSKGVYRIKEGLASMLHLLFKSETIFLKFESELIVIKSLDVSNNKYVTFFPFFRNVFAFSAEHVVDRENSKNGLAIFVYILFLYRNRISMK